MKIASFVYIFVHVAKELLINLDISGRKSSPDRLWPFSSQLPIWQHAGKGTKHFNPLEDYRFVHHWFSEVKTP